MSKYGSGMLSDTIQKIQKRKKALQTAGSRAPAKAVRASAPAKGKQVNKNNATAAKRVAKTVQKSAGKGMSEREALRKRIASRVAKAKKKGMRTLRTGVSR